MKKIIIDNSKLTKIEKDLISEYNMILDSEKELSRSIKKMKLKIRLLKTKFDSISDKRKKVLKKIKSENLRILTSCSVVCDKRWNSYICIFKNSKSQKSIYLGKHHSIIKELSPFYNKKEFDNSSKFVKTELKKIISSIQDKIIKLNDSNEIILVKNKLKNIIDIYSESGEWDFWSIEK